MQLFGGACWLVIMSDVGSGIKRQIWSMGEIICLLHRFGIEALRAAAAFYISFAVGRHKFVNRLDSTVAVSGSNHAPLLMIHHQSGFRIGKAQLKN